jgi:hypothetical protein
VLIFGRLNAMLLYLYKQKQNTMKQIYKNFELIQSNELYLAYLNNELIFATVFGFDTLKYIIDNSNK